MNTAGMKVLILGLIVFLVTTIFGFFLILWQYDVYVIKDEYFESQHMKAFVTIGLFAQVFSVIAILIAVIGILMLLKEVEAKPSQ